MMTDSSILPGKSQEQKSRAGYSPWGPKDLDTHSCHAQFIGKAIENRTQKAFFLIHLNSDMCSGEITTVPSNSAEMSKWDMFV